MIAGFCKGSELLLAAMPEGYKFQTMHGVESK